MKTGLFKRVSERVVGPIIRVLGHILVRLSITAALVGVTPSIALSQESQTPKTLPATQAAQTSHASQPPQLATRAANRARTTAAREATIRRLANASESERSPRAWTAPHGSRAPRDTAPASNRAQNRAANRATARTSSHSSRRPAAPRSATRTDGPVKQARGEKPPAQPNLLIAQRTQRVLANLKSRPVRPIEDSARELALSASATKAGFLRALYAHRLVEASWATEMLSDKRIVSEVLTRELGAEKANRYYPKTLGLREFLTSHGFIDAKGEIKKEEAETIEAALYQEFPAGFIARVAVGVAPSETTQGLFKDTDAFMVELMRPGTPLYHPSHANAAVSSHLLGGQVTSGEAVVLQENLTAWADAKKPLKIKSYQEVRVHTYEGEIVAGAIPARWVQKERLSKPQSQAAEKFVQEFLESLPPSILARQAWGVDVAVFDNGEMRINDIVTNHGQRVAWSSYLEQPRVIEAYANHFDKIAGIHFVGFSGWLINHGFANYFPYWQRRIEKARGFGKVLAYLPPWP